MRQWFHRILHDGRGGLSACQSTVTAFWCVLNCRIRAPTYVMIAVMAGRLHSSSTCLSSRCSRSMLLSIIPVVHAHLSISLADDVLLLRALPAFLPPIHDLLAAFPASPHSRKGKLGKTKGEGRYIAEECWSIETRHERLMSCHIHHLFPPCRRVSVLGCQQCYRLIQLAVGT